MLQMTESPARIHLRRRHNHVSAESEEMLDNWSFESKVAKEREVRLLKKMDEIKSREKWTAKGPFGAHGSYFTKFVQLNMGIFSRSGRRMLSHVRPTASRFDEFHSLVCKLHHLLYILPVVLN